MDWQYGNWDQKLVPMFMNYQIAGGVVSDDFGMIMNCVRRRHEYLSCVFVLWMELA